MDFEASVDPESPLGIETKLNTDNFEGVRRSGLHYVRETRRSKRIGSEWKSSALRKERQRANELMERILSAKQRTVSDQQCEIDVLRRKMSLVLEDNRFLREQAHMQSTIIEKLDGKNAKMPILMNSQMEEIRIYREQLRRLKEIFLRTNKARQEAETAKQKAEDELQHLRSLAFSKHLPEREELLSAVSRMQTELEEQEKSKVALERYIINLEKNQRCERKRLLRAQKDLQITCDKLTDNIRELQFAVQDKQKMIDIQHMHMQRSLKCQARVSIFGDGVDTLLPKQPKLPALQLKSSKPLVEDKDDSPSQIETVQLPIVQTKEKDSIRSVAVKLKSTVSPPLRQSIKTTEIDLTHIEIKPAAIRPKTSTVQVIVPSHASSLRPKTSPEDNQICNIDKNGVKQVQFTNSAGKIVALALPEGKKDQDETYELLRANERLARIVAECKLQSHNEGIATTKSNPMSNNNPSTLGHSSIANERPVTGEWKRVENFQMGPNMETLDWPELETVEPMPDSNMRPVLIKNVIPPLNLTGDICAGGDLPENIQSKINEIIRKIPDRHIEDMPQKTDRPSSAITNIIRDICYKEAQEKLLFLKHEPVKEESEENVNKPEVARSVENKLISSNLHPIGFYQCDNTKPFSYSIVPSPKPKNQSVGAKRRSRTAIRSAKCNNFENKIIHRHSATPKICQSRGKLSPASRMLAEEHDNEEAGISRESPTSMIPSRGTRLASTIFSTSSGLSTSHSSGFRCPYRSKNREPLLPYIDQKHENQE